MLHNQFVTKRRKRGFVKYNALLKVSNGNASMVDHEVTVPKRHPVSMQVPRRSVNQVRKSWLRGRCAARGMFGVFALCTSGYGAVPSAHAAFPVISDRDWAIDLYQGAALGAARTIAMGGAAVGVGEGSVGGVANPAAIAAWPATDNAPLRWDFHFDYFTGALSQDFDNNGTRNAQSTPSAVTAGVVLGFGAWSVGGNISTVTSTMTPPAGTPMQYTGSFANVDVVVGREWRNGVRAGVALRRGRFLFVRGAETIFTVDATTAAFGAQYAPPAQAWRVGATVALPAVGDEVAVSACDPLNCDGVILPERVAVPWRVAVGAAYRRGPTPWNVRLTSPFRDERAVTVAADLVVTGHAPHGFGLEAFAQNQWQASGRNVVVSPRLGVEYEPWAGRLRLRAGGYYEPARFASTVGRAHVTFGGELALFQFQLWGPRRLQLHFVGDYARAYANAGVSIGFWH